MSIQSKKEECALSVKAPEPGENDFTETACGLARVSMLVLNLACLR
jgi:hypothetical protein